MITRLLTLFFTFLAFAKLLLIPIEAHSQAAPKADFTAGNTIICPGDPVNFIDQSSNSPETYTWFFSGGTPDTSSSPNPTGIVYNTPGYYDVTLIVSNQYGNDTLTKLYYINVQGSFFIMPDTAIYEGSTITLYAGGGTSYLWSPGGSASDTMTVKVSETTVYHCMIFDGLTSCKFEESVKVWIIYDWLLIANTFHPTADYPFISVHAGTGKMKLQDIRWTIYDRWGEKIFESTDISMYENQTGWDGTFRGKQCNTGVYVYTLAVTFIDGKKWTKNGNITLIR